MTGMNLLEIMEQESHIHESILAEMHLHGETNVKLDDLRFIVHECIRLRVPIRIIPISDDMVSVSL